MTRTFFTRRLIALAAALPVAVVVAGEPAPIELQPQQAQALGIVTRPAQAGAALPLATHPGRVVVPPAQQRVLAAPLGALVTALHVAVGDTVRTGQLLAVLRSPEAQALQRETLQAASQEELTRQALRRDEQLHAEELIALSRLEASRAAHRQALALAQERRQALRLAGAAGGELSLRSPIAGTVLEVSVTLGQRVEAAAPLLRVALLSPLWLELQVPAAQADSIRAGDTVQVAGREATGRVLRVGPAVDAATQTLVVRAEVASAARLRPGEVVQAQLARAAGDAALVQVPAAALVRQGGSVAVFVQREPGRYALVPVQTVSHASGHSVVTGLQPGAAVVVQGTAALLALARP